MCKTFNTSLQIYLSLEGSTCCGEEVLEGTLVVDEFINWPVNVRARSMESLWPSREKQTFNYPSIGDLSPGR